FPASGVWVKTSTWMKSKPFFAPCARAGSDAAALAATAPTRKSLRFMMIPQSPWRQVMPQELGPQRHVRCIIRFRNLMETAMHAAQMLKTHPQAKDQKNDALIRC